MSGVILYLVELALPPEGFRSVLLEIDAFHRERRIPVRRLLAMAAILVSPQFFQIGLFESHTIQSGSLMMGLYFSMSAMFFGRTGRRSPASRPRPTRRPRP